MFLADTPDIVASSSRVLPVSACGKFATMFKSFLAPCLSFSLAAINGYSVTLVQQVKRLFEVITVIPSLTTLSLWVITIITFLRSGCLAFIIFESLSVDNFSSSSWFDGVFGVEVATVATLVDEFN
jgi:hypothetical protein